VPSPGWATDGRRGPALWPAVRPGQWSIYAAEPPSIQVDAAAYAALLAIDHGRSGVFNTADLDDEVSAVKARAELGWRADFRMD
jgi:hypothetical protein